MKYQDSPDNHTPELVQYIDHRWKSLSELETKSAERVFNYLFLVSGGATAATLTFIGNAVHDNRQVPTGIMLMLALFATSLLLVGLLKLFLTYKAIRVFRNWRTSAERFYSNDLDWEDVLSSDGEQIRKGTILVHLCAWLSYATLVLGVMIGYHKLNEGIQNAGTETPVHAEKTVISSEKFPGGIQSGAITQPLRPRTAEKRRDDRKRSGSTATTAPEKEITAPQVPCHDLNEP